MEKLEYSEAQLQRIKLLIPWGQDNKITVEQLAKRTRYLDEAATHQRHRLAIRLLRLEGEPIVCNSKGYWRTRKPAELLKFAASLQKRINSIEMTRQAIKDAAEIYSRKRKR